MKLLLLASLLISFAAVSQTQNKMRFKEGGVPQAATLYSSLDANSTETSTSDNTMTEPEPEPVTESIPAPYSLTFDEFVWKSGYGAYKSSEISVGTKPLAHDNDVSTYIGPMRVFSPEVWIRVDYRISPLYTGVVTVEWSHRVVNGGTARFIVGCFGSDGSLQPLFEDTALYSDDNYTRATHSGNVTDCQDIFVFAQDKGNGDAHFNIHEISVTP